MPTPKMNPKEQEAYDEALRQIEECRSKGEEGTKLDLGDLGLTILPPEIGQLTALTSLSLYNNQLTTLAPEVTRLSALQELYVSKNHLTELPPEFDRLKRLRRLSLYNNRLTILPPAIGGLSALTALHLDNNQLATLPPEIAGLTALRALHLYDNQLTLLPPEIGQLTALTELFLHDNPALGIPHSVLGPTYRDVYLVESEALKTPARPADILNFYFAQRQAAVAGTLRRLNEIKLMLVGDGGAGKTSLRRFFMGEGHVEKEAETLGIALGAFPLRCGEEEITVRLWDFAGQEITHALHQFFLTEGCAYIVVVEPRSDNEQDDAEKWLKLIERYGKGAPALVVMNKQDIRRPNGYDLDRNWLKERFSFIQGFAPTSCGETREGCGYLRELLHDVLMGMPETDLWVDGSWVRVKDECFSKARAGQERQYLTLAEFRALCERHGEKNDGKQESLARILHNLGAVLHFVDEPRLRDTTVLNPHWVTDGAYRLLRCKDAPGSDGTLTLPEAMAAVPGADETAARYLLGLMERFEMCFTVEDAEDGTNPAQKWLVPGALDKNQPDKVKPAEWQEPETVRLRYVYDPLPQGVLPRFIVMTHLLSEGLPRWRSGVELHDGAARALIRKGQKENTVEVTVQGPEADRERLVKTVRGYLARIHRDLPEPRPKEFQALTGTDDYREVEQMRADEQMQVPMVVKTSAGFVKKSATVELNRTSAEPPRTRKKRPLRVFLSYSHDDKRAQGLFRKNLVALESDGYITFWEDPNIKPDMEWRAEIDRELESMDIFVGLLTTNFVASNFIQRVEFKRALERRKEKTAGMWLVLVDDRRIEGTKYEGIQLLKPGGKAATDHKSLRAGFDVAEKELHALVKHRWEAQPDREEGKRLPGDAVL
jgi:internalin A